MFIISFFIGAALALLLFFWKKRDGNNDANKSCWKDQRIMFIGHNQNELGNAIRNHIVKDGAQIVQPNSETLDCVIAMMVSNPGSLQSKLFTEISPKEFQSYMNDSFIQHISDIKTGIKKLCDSKNKEKKQKRIIAVIDGSSSLAGHAGYSVYAASNFAIRAVMESLEKELKPLGIKVHVYHCGKLDPNGNWRSEQLAEHLCHGVSSDYYHITSNYMIDFLRISRNGLTPRSHPILETFILPFVPIIEWYVRYTMQS